MSDNQNAQPILEKREQEFEKHVPSTAKTSCWTPGFIALLVTQFTVAMNDNVFRWLIIPIGKYLVRADQADQIRTLGGVFLLVPFLLFASVAGFTTDRFPRRSVMIWCKFVEMVLLAIAVVVICFIPGLSGGVKIGVLLAILFFLGLQSTFFSPSKYGIIPDIVPENQISNANGIVAMMTMIAIVSGQLLGVHLFAWTTLFGDEQRTTLLSDPGGANWIVTAGVLVGIALIGYIASFFLPKHKAVAPEAKFPINMFKQTFIDLRMLVSYRSLFWVAIASSFFWGLAALSQTNIDKYASDFLKVKQEYVTILTAVLALGIGAGSALAGWLSRGRIELGMVPIGAFGMGFFVLLLGFTPSLSESVLPNEGSVQSASYIYGSLGLMFLGLTAGLYDVPLAAYLQKNSPREKRGRILAAYNFFSFGFMLLFTCLFFGMTQFFNPWGTSSSLWIWLCTGLLVLAVFGVLLKYLMLPFIAFLIRTYIRAMYHIEVIGEENVPMEGGVLLVSNHVSYLDGPVLYSFSPRPVRFFAHNNYIKGFIANYLARKTRVMRIVPAKKSVIDAIKMAREGLANGDVIGIFPEGGLTRTGQIKEFEPGYTAFLKGNEHVPIVPVFIGGLYGSVLSYADRKRSFFSWPRALRRRVVVEFGKPLPANTPPHVVKHKVDEMAADQSARQTGKNFVPVRQFLRSFKAILRQKDPRFVDSTGTELRAKDFLLRTLVARRVLHREVFGKGEKFVAILAPPSVGGAIFNIATALDRRILINLNYSFNSELINYCLKQTETKHILTSRKVMERFDYKFDAEVVCIEDVIGKVTLIDKMLAALYTYLLPTWMVERLLGLHLLKADDTNTIVFTSGSTGLPKGVMLSNRGISENVDGALELLKLREKDMVFSVLPFFHAFGYTVGIWLPAILGLKVVYHYSPLEPKVIGRMSNKFRPTFMVATATFLRSYIKRCPREDFENLKGLVLGAEKMPKDIADAWEEKYGVRPTEGYGTTELSPVVCVCVPPSHHHDDFQPDVRESSVGRPLPNVAAKVVDVDTWEEMPIDTPGMLLIKGANVMQGYFKQPELTAKAIHDGWNVTGDIARIDKDGFIFITGRESRISKIGGEMVPHILIEEQLLEIFDKHSKHEQSAAEKADDEKTSEVKTSVPLVVASVPDDKKGERIVVLHTKLPISPDEMCKEMRTMGSPMLWIPMPQNFYEVDFIPVLGTGKLDLAAVKKMVVEICMGKT